MVLDTENISFLLKQTIQSPGRIFCKEQSAEFSTSSGVNRLYCFISTDSPVVRQIDCTYIITEITIYYSLKNFLFQYVYKVYKVKLYNAL